MPGCVGNTRRFVAERRCGFQVTPHQSRHTVSLRGNELLDGLPRSLSESVLGVCLAGATGRSLPELNYSGVEGFTNIERSTPIPCDTPLRCTISFPTAHRWQPPPLETGSSQTPWSFKLPSPAARVVHETYLSLTYFCIGVRNGTSKDTARIFQGYNKRHTLGVPI